MGFKEKIKGIVARATVLAAVVAGLLAVDVMNVKAADTDYLTFTALQDGSSVTINFDSCDGLEYNKNDSGWITGSYGVSISLNEGEKVQLKATNMIINGNPFVISGQIKASGSVTSLTDGVGTNPEVTLTECCYADMFAECTGLVDVSKLKLPAKTLKEFCYANMFAACTGIKEAPALPAMILDDSCYSCMFQDCSSLKKAPELPALTLEPTCYYGMFIGCTSLTETPALPATDLADGCYSSMFDGCTGLTSVPDLPVRTLAMNCYNAMFANCTGLEMWYEPKPDRGLTREWKIDAEDDCGALGYMFDGCPNDDYFCLDKDFPDTIVPVSYKTYYIKALPTPTPTPQKNEASKEKGIDLDTNKSEVPYGTVLTLNTEDKSVLQDIKVHPVTTKTKTNQEFLTESYAKKLGKKARIILTKSIHPRNHLLKDQLGAKKILKWINLEKKAQPIYAVCYNETDKAYYLTGTLDANGTAVFNDFIAREATNITIFVLE